ncbi:MAG: aminopeptidase [Clostridiales bacterium]|nr:aminopeptidase [Clostridiales bacterium]
MRIIGLTGTTGAGKSTAASILRDLGVCVLDADRIYHELLASSIEMNRELREEFPSAYVEDRLDRKSLGRLVFGSEEKLSRLNSITHRYVMLTIEERLCSLESNGCEFVVIDAPLLFESGADKLCRATIGITAQKEVRLSRILARDNISEEYALQRIESQPDEEFYSSRCTYMVENNSTEHSLRERIEEIIKDIEDKGARDMDTTKKNPRDKLFFTKKNGYDTICSSEKKEIFKFAEGYKKFITASKTERMAVKSTVALAEKNGFVPYSRGMKLRPGDRIYTVNRSKYIILAAIGTRPMSDGIRVVASHIDSPRLDLKPLPLYEDKELAFFKTHYYGGIRKYQWVTIPLELYGVVALKDGSVFDVEIGSRPTDPMFTITDLLPHLGKDQAKKTLEEGIAGESLNLLIGSIPSESDTEGSDRVKLAILEYLNDEYGITEEDFLSAELSAVPAFEARDIGLDRSLVGAYGHDDRVCAYSSVMAIFDQKIPEKTCLCVLADKEEIGSVGSTGMKSYFFDNFIEELCGGKTTVNRCFSSSSCLSADVCNAFDPNYPEVSEPRNSAYCNYGVNMMKYTGARGKSGSSDADAEYIASLRDAFDKADVIWQTSELGKVDQGGGGTVAGYMSERNIDTVDLGVPVLSMHAPYEVIAKLDLYMAYRAMSAFYGMKSGDEEQTEE